MAGALPLTKLGSLFVKTLAKPLSKQIKARAAKYDASKTVLIAIGQTSHSITSRMKIWSSGYRVKKIAPLKPESALQDGAEFLGESFIFFVSGYLVIWEYRRSSESTRKKNEKLQAKLDALDIRLKAVEDVVKQNSQSILGLRGSHYKEPESAKLVPINEKQASENKENNDDTTNTETKIETKSRWRIWRFGK